MTTTTIQDSVGQRPRAAPYGEYLADLIDEMARRPSFCHLVHYLRHYGRRSFIPYAERDATPPDLKAIHARNCDWMHAQRLWDCRERARAIIEGAEPWPRRLLLWKAHHEERWLMGADMPAWLDPANNPAPYECKRRKARVRRPADIAKKIQRQIQNRAKGRR